MLASRHVLLFGSGMMAESVVKYILNDQRNTIHIASNILADAKKIAENQGVDRCSFSQCNVQNAQIIRPLIEKADVVISYVPAFLHIHIARVCLQVGKHLVTASYISKQMKQLDQSAKQKGLIFLNELGLDPGIDHLATMRTVDEVYEKGGKIVEYESWCGGVPSPACCNNPLGYKFTWSPLSAFRALNNKAVYILDSKIFQIEPAELLYCITQIEINQALSLQGYPNRDSIQYKTTYGLKDATKVLRGTLRYRGFLDIINAFKEIGYFTQSKIFGEDWLSYTEELLKNQEGQTLIEKIRNKTVLKNHHYQTNTPEQNQKKCDHIVSALKYFGFLQKNKFYDPNLTSLENLIKLIQPKTCLRPGQTDLIAMQHKFIIQLGAKKIMRKSSLIQIGQKNGFSAMSLTVGTPTAIGATLILNNKIKERGVIRPIYKDIYEPVLEMLQKVGIKLVEQDEQL